MKEHPFFKGIDWNQVYLQKYPPPLIPPRGEVNAADAFDIGSFDEEDTKGIKVSVVSFYMSRAKRICVFEHSVITNFNCACPAIQKGQGSGFLSEGSS